MNIAAINRECAGTMKTTDYIPEALKSEGVSHVFMVPELVSIINVEGVIGIVTKGGTM
jgi:hypothetical protein